MSTETEAPSVIAYICGIEHKTFKDGPWLVVGEYSCQALPSKWLQSIAVALEKGMAPEILKFRDTYRFVVIAIYDNGTNVTNDISVDTISSMISNNDSKKE